MSNQSELVGSFVDALREAGMHVEGEESKKPVDTAFVEMGEYNYKNQRYELEGEYPVYEIEGRRVIVLD